METTTSFPWVLLIPGLQILWMIIYVLWDTGVIGRDEPIKRKGPRNE